jgi:hypothetical protein
LLPGKLAEMKLPTRSIGNLQHKMQGLNLSIFTHHLKNDRVLVYNVNSTVYFCPELIYFPSSFMKTLPITKARA